MIHVEIKDDGLFSALGQVAVKIRDQRNLMRRIAGTLETTTLDNFSAQGRPAWLGLAPSTLKRRGGDAQILQDKGHLKGSVSSVYGRDFAQVGTNLAYAAIHQFGGVIERAPHSSWGALRTNHKGELLRQGSSGTLKNLAVFAKSGHKRIRKIRYSVGAYSISIPARPYLPGYANGYLQPQALRACQEDVRRWLSELGFQ